MPVLDPHDVLPSLLEALHERSDAELRMRARAQFQGSDEAFRDLAERYYALAPERRGAFLKAHGLSTEDSAEGSGAALSLAVSAPMGAFLSQMVLAYRPETILELGSSNGVSTLYFASALRRLGRGKVIATELRAEKCEALRRHVAHAGLEAFVEVWQGDVFETVGRVAQPVDLAFIDIWASAYLDIFRRIEPLLRPGSVVLADNMFTAPDEVEPFRAYLEAHPGFSATTLAFESGVAFAVSLGG